MGGDDTCLLTQGGITALMFAATNGHAGCVKLLLDAGADKNAKTDVRGRSSAYDIGDARMCVLVVLRFDWRVGSCCIIVAFFFYF